MITSNFSERCCSHCSCSAAGASAVVDVTGCIAITVHTAAVDTVDIATAAAKIMRLRRKAYIEHLEKAAQDMQDDLLRQADFKPRQVHL